MYKIKSQETPRTHSRDVETAAQENAERYEPMLRKAAKAAFIEGIMWAQKTYKTYRSC